MKLSTSEKLTLISLDILFVLICYWISKRFILQINNGLFIALLGLASFRLGRAVSYNLIFAWLREMVGITPELDSSFAGMSNMVKSRGVVGIIASLICCPICAATWSGVVLLGTYSANNSLGQVLIIVLGVAGIAEIAHWGSNMMEWKGREGREISGMNYRKEKV